jgi:hypothetical protein
MTNSSENLRDYFLWFGGGAKIMPGNVVVKQETALSYASKKRVQGSLSVVPSHKGGCKNRCFASKTIYGFT